MEEDQGHSEHGAAAHSRDLWLPSSAESHAKPSSTPGTAHTASSSAAQTKHANLHPSSTDLCRAHSPACSSEPASSPAQCPECLSRARPLGVLTRYSIRNSESPSLPALSLRSLRFSLQSADMAGATGLSASPGAAHPGYSPELLPGIPPS